MPQESSKDFTSMNIVWQEARSKPFDYRKLQAGMFSDRPDLWTKKRVKRTYTPANQLSLKESNDERI